MPTTNAHLAMVRIMETFDRPWDPACRTAAIVSEVRDIVDDYLAGVQLEAESAVKRLKGETES